MIYLAKDGIYIKIGYAQSTPTNNKYFLKELI